MHLYMLRSRLAGGFMTLSSSGRGCVHHGFLTLAQLLIHLP